MKRKLVVSSWLWTFCGKRAAKTEGSCPRSCLISVINLSTVPGVNDMNNQPAVIHAVNNAVMPHTEPVETRILSALQGTDISLKRKHMDCRQYPVTFRFFQPQKEFFDRLFHDNRILHGSFSNSFSNSSSVTVSC